MQWRLAAIKLANGWIHTCREQGTHDVYALRVCGNMQQRLTKTVARVYKAGVRYQQRANDVHVVTIPCHSSKQAFSSG